MKTISKCKDGQLFYIKNYLGYCHFLCCNPFQITIQYFFCIIDNLFKFICRFIENFTFTYFLYNEIIKFKIYKIYSP